MGSGDDIDADLNDDGSDSFGPSTDLIISVMAVLLLLLTIARTSYTEVLGGNADLGYVGRNQQALVSNLERAFGVEQSQHSDFEAVTILKLPSNDEVRVLNRATNQTITFGDQILFASGADTLSPNGEEVLKDFIGALKPELLAAVQEIQIQGHADNQAYVGAEGNLGLAARRAMAVFRFMQASAIDPTQNLISATSFGEFKPAARDPLRPYNDHQLLRDNLTSAQRASNRRIEIVLVYRLSPPTPQDQTEPQ